MSTPLQGFGFRESPYERPTQTWVCGWAAEGRACAAGPDRRGRCGAAFECAPVRRGDRWHCARGDAWGGTCAEGPFPDGACCRPILKCQPVRSLRARRRLAGAWTAAVAIAGVAFLTAGPGGERLLLPGALSPAHATLAADCAACHRGPAQDRNCLRCHDLGPQPNLPHGMPEATLARVREAALATAPGGQRPWTLVLARSLGGGWPRERGAPACAACHREHRGPEGDLVALGDRRCQACHARVFAAFTSGHPEFSGYPSGGRAPVRFDHRSHIGRHFREAAADRAPDDCSGCHAADPTGRWMPVRGFDAACGACHRSQIEGEGRAGGKGVPFLTVPGLDLDTLAARGARIGEWPADADGPPSRFTDLLLFPEPGIAGDLATIAGLDLLDLSGAGSEAIVAVERYAWAVKSLFFDLAAAGHPALRSRLEEAAGGWLGPGDPADLTGRLPVDALRGALRGWFPRLRTEVLGHRAGQDAPTRGIDVALPAPPPASTASPAPPSDPGDLLAGSASGDDLLASAPASPGEEGKVRADSKPSAPAEATAEAAVSAGGWYRDDFTFSMSYRPAGHADTFLRSWIDLAGRATGSREAGALLRALADPKGVGACGKCHDLDPAGEAADGVLWAAPPPGAGERGFTRFAHAPHFPLLAPAGCQACHPLLQGSGPVSAPADPAASRPPVDFEPIAKRVCAGCHARAGARSDCLECHAYHVGRLALSLPATPLSIAQEPLPQPPE